MPADQRPVSIPSGESPVSWEVDGIGSVDLRTVYASFDGTSAAGDFRPAVTIRSQNGVILARVFPGETVAAGDAADVSFVPFARPAAVSSGIKYDTDPQLGNFLVVETDGASVDEIGQHYHSDPVSSEIWGILLDSPSQDVGVASESGKLCLYVGVDIHGGSTTGGTGIEARSGLGIDLFLQAGESFTVYDSNVDPILRMTEGSPDLHIPTGGTVVADL